MFPGIETRVAMLGQAPVVTLAVTGTTLDLGMSPSPNIGCSTTSATVSSLGKSCRIGVVKTVVFTVATILTHNAASLILPRAANYTAQPNDVFQFLHLGNGNWRCLSYLLANGRSLGSQYHGEPSTAPATAPVAVGDVAIGDNAISNNGPAVGKLARANGAYSAAFGRSAYVTGVATQATAIGASATANRANSMALSAGGCSSNMVNGLTWGAISGPWGGGNAVQCSQTSRVVLTAQTASATPTELFGNGVDTGRLELIDPNANALYTFHGFVTAQSGVNCAVWEVKAAARRATGGNVTLVGTPTVTQLFVSGTTGWSVVITADTVNQSVKVGITGTAAITVNWLARFETTEMAS